MQTEIEQQQKNKRGLLILFEGLDRCGKSTQCQNLYETLNKTQQTTLIRFPERTTNLGKMIDSYLKGGSQLNDQTIHLLFSANRWEKTQEINEKLEQGQNIIMDRYAYSGVAFTSAKGLDLNWCKNCDVGLPKPDITFYLEASEEVIAKRGNFGDEIYEKKEFQQKVKKQFEILKQEEGYWTIIDASQDIDIISQQIYKKVQETQQNINLNQSVQKLWI